MDKWIFSMRWMKILIMDNLLVGLVIRSSMTSCAIGVELRKWLAIFVSSRTGHTGMKCSGTTSVMVTKGGIPHANESFALALHTYVHISMASLLALEVAETTASKSLDTTLWIILSWHDSFRISKCSVMNQALNDSIAFNMVWISLIWLPLKAISLPQRKASW